MSAPCGSCLRVTSVMLIVIAMFGGCSSAQSKRSEAGDADTDSLASLRNGEILYGYRCKGCHEPATPGAPDRTKLALYEQREIVSALRRGKMKNLSAGLTKSEMQQIADFLSIDPVSKR